MQRPPITSKCYTVPVVVICSRWERTLGPVGVHSFITICPPAHTHTHHKGSRNTYTIMLYRQTYQGWKAEMLVIWLAQWNKGGTQRVVNFIHASVIGVCVPGRDQSCSILRLFSFFVLNNVPFLAVQSIMAYAFSRWMNFRVLSSCSRNWNYER